MAISVRVHFATNRNPIAGYKLFGSNFRDGNPKHYVTGSITVTRFSSKPDSGWEPDHSTLQLDPPSNAGNLFTAPPGANHLAAFTRDRIAHHRVAPSATSSGGLILLHGFASTFLDALRRAAQVVTAYKAGEVFVFSWPANGIVNIPNYREDQQDARKSGAAIAHSILHMLKVLVAAEPRARPRLNVVAHSMGAYALRHALQAIIKRDPSLIKPGLLEGALLMAADESDDALSRADRLRPLLRLAKRTTVYHADGDLALAVSRIINSWAPLGLFRPRNLASLPASTTSVNCSDVASTQGDNGESHFRHQYYRLSPWVINDAAQVIADIPPHKIGGRLLDPFDNAGGRAWWIPYDTGAAFAARKRLSVDSIGKRKTKTGTAAVRRKRA